MKQLTYEGVPKGETFLAETIEHKRNARRDEKVGEFRPFARLRNGPNECQVLCDLRQQFIFVHLFDGKLGSILRAEGPELYHFHVETSHKGWDHEWSER
jgi:hypothetical protein